MAPAVVIRPILLPANSANHSVPSGPVVIPRGSLLAVVTGYPVMSLYAPDCGSALTGSPSSNAAKQKAFAPRAIQPTWTDWSLDVPSGRCIRFASLDPVLVYPKTHAGMDGIYAGRKQPKGPEHRPIVRCPCAIMVWGFPADLEIYEQPY